MKKVLFIISLIVVLGLGYWVAYEKGKTDKFYCELTFGRWVEETRTNSLTEIALIDTAGCHNRSDIMNDMRK